MRFIGIDPGVSGGLACLDDDGSVIDARKMPETERDVLDLIVSLRGDPSEVVRGVIERVRSSPQMGVTSAFTFGRSYGGLRMALLAAGVSFEEVLPHAWQTALGCRTGGGKLGERDQTAAKNKTKSHAQGWFAGVKITHATADALLLAEYVRRVERGMIGVVSGKARATRPRRVAESTSLF